MDQVAFSGYASCITAKGQRLQRRLALVQIDVGERVNIVCPRIIAKRKESEDNRVRFGVGIEVAVL